MTGYRLDTIDRGRFLPYLTTARRASLPRARQRVVRSPRRLLSPCFANTRLLVGGEPPDAHSHSLPSPYMYTHAQSDVTRATPLKYVYPRARGPPRVACSSIAIEDARHGHNRSIDMRMRACARMPARAHIRVRARARPSLRTRSWSARACTCMSAERPRICARVFDPDPDH